MQKQISIFFGLIVSLIVIATTTAVGQCVRDYSFKVNSVAGNVLYVSKDRKQSESLADVSVRLLKNTKDGQEVVAEEKTNAYGSFLFADVRPGRYDLYASKEMLDTIVIRIKVVKNTSKARNSFLIIELGFTEYSHTDSCEGTAKLEWR